MSVNKRGKHKKSKKHTNKYKRIRALLILFLIVFLILIVRIVTKSKTIEAVNFEKDKYQHEEDTRLTETSSFPTDVYGVPVHTELIEEDTNARPGTKRKIKYIVVHETDNFIAGTGAKNHAAFLSNNNEEATSWHYTVDDTEIYHHIPDNEIANHAGERTGNLYGIGIELCVNEDGNFEKTFDNAAKLVAYLIKEYGLTIDAIKTHHDFSGKDCPHSILEDDRMDEFVKKVENLLKNR